MPRRTLRFGGFAITVEVPGSVGRGWRRLAGAAPAEKLRVEPPPPARPLSRARAAAVFDDLLTRARADPPGPRGRPATDAEIERHGWYHTIELPGGATNGRWDHRALVPHLGLPDDLRGRRVLDVGSGNGFWAFELERRGADVTSVDIESFAEVDLPPALRAMADARPVELSFRRGLELARQRLGSKVRLVHGNVYDLHPDRIGTFDLVHAGDILLHLRDPALALQRLRAVTAGEVWIVDYFDPTLDQLGAGPCLTRYRGGWDEVTWWAPALSTLVQMTADAGFHDVRPTATYRLADRDHVVGLWRAVLRGRGGPGAAAPARPAEA